MARISATQGPGLPTPDTSSPPAQRFDRLANMARTIIPACATLALTGCVNTFSPADPSEIETFTGSLEITYAQEMPPLTGKLTATDAVNRALALNQEIRAAQYEAAVELAQARVESGELLPDAVAESNYARRDRPAYSRSNTTKTYSYSSDLATWSHNIDLSLNVLDFGLTLIRMRQAADKAVKKAESARRVALRITEDTRSTYWQAVALQTLVPRLMLLTPKVNEALKLSRSAAQDAVLDPSDFINFQRDLLNTRRELNDLFSSLAGAEYKLKNLTSIPSGSRIVLDDKLDQSLLTLPKTTAEQDVALALRERSEIREQFYEMRITQAEVDAAILKILPGAVLTGSFNRDTNSYLLNADWMSWSARLSANVMDLVRLPAKLDSIQAEQDVNRQNAIAAASAIAMQVYVARAKLAIEYSIYRDAADFAANQQSLLRQVRNSVKAGKLPEQSIAREELAALLADIRAIVAFGELNAAYATYQSALGILAAPMPGTIASRS